MARRMTSAATAAIIDFGTCEPHAVTSVSVYAEHRQMPQRPSDIVDQNVFLAEQHRRSKYGVGQAGLFNVLLHFRLAAEIGKIEVRSGLVMLMCAFCFSQSRQPQSPGAVGSLFVFFLWVTVILMSAGIHPDVGAVVIIGRVIIGDGCDNPELEDCG